MFFLLYDPVCFRQAIGQFTVRNLLYTDQNLKENAHFGAHLFTSEKKFK